MAENSSNKTEIQQVLTTDQDQIQLETIQGEQTSPLNSPVIEKDIGGEPMANTQPTDDNWNIWKPEEEGKVSELHSEVDYRKQVEKEIEREKNDEPLDAPEQQINVDDKDIDGAEQLSDKDFEMPLSQANQTADALLGITNNLLSASGSFFVKVKKHQEFYEFGEIVDVIDQQNEKNIKRIVLDKEDKALLRPLLSQVIRKKAKQLTPEQQLMGAVASIVIKKGQTVMEIRGENKILENRLLAIIKEQKESTEIHTPSSNYKEASLSEEALKSNQDFSTQEVDEDDNKNHIITESDLNKNSVVEYADDLSDEK